MRDSLCRLTVQHAGDDEFHAVDLALPSQTCVGQLMPAIVDLVCRDTVASETGRLWRLSRVGGPPLDESLTLDDNEIRDGELLLLTAAETPAPEWADSDPNHTVARAGNASGGSSMQMLPAICCVFMRILLGRAA